MPTFDAVIIGGGPAGAATALALGRRGYSVLLVERDDYSSTRIGETFPPEIQLPLAELGAWQAFLDQRHLRCEAILSAWGDADLIARDFLFNPYGSGWHVDRTRFDCMLYASVAQAGVEVMASTRLLACVPRDRGGWRLQLLAPVRPLELSARFVVDATGRKSVLSRQLGSRRMACDHLIGISMLFEPVNGCEPAPPVAIIETAPAGWWYTAPLPSGRLIAAYMTEAGLWRRVCNASAAHWQLALASTHHTRSRLHRYTAGQRLLISPAGSSRLDRIAGAEWLAVGDAALALDPLAGQGVCDALWSGLRAASTIDAHLRGNDSALRAYQVAGEAAFEEYLHQRRQHYCRETRWKDSEFWRRAQGLGD